MLRKFFVLALLGIPQAIWSESESNDDAAQSKNLYGQFNELNANTSGTLV